jgi:tight adherence protein B
MTVAAVLFAALAGGLLVGPVGTGRRGSRLRIPDRGGGRWLLGGLTGAAAALLVWLDGLRLVLALILLGCTAGGVSILRRARTRKVAERRRASIVEVCEALVGELRAGQPLVASLERCVEVWPEFEPVVAAGRLGADVPGALRRLALLPGAEGLREVASAWQVSERSGSGLSSALGQVAGSARARQSTRHLVSSELASAQATARLVAVLPLAVLAMSSGIGGHPWHFLLATPIGLGCLAVGAASAFFGLWWIDRIAVQVLRA